MPKRIIVLGLMGLIETVEFVRVRASTRKVGGDECTDSIEGGGGDWATLLGDASPSLSSEESKSSMALGCVCKVSKNDVGEEGAGE